MDAREIAGLGPSLMAFLTEFDDCFGRSEPRGHLRTYVAGQLSDLPRKSIEPMALAADVPPRTLQRFLELVEWDEQRLRDKLQQTIARDHADPEAIGIIDETGSPKKGKHTAGVKRQLVGWVVSTHLLQCTPLRGRQSNYWDHCNGSGGFAEPTLQTVP